MVYFLKQNRSPLVKLVNIQGVIGERLTKDLETVFAEIERIKHEEPMSDKTNIISNRDEYIGLVNDKEVVRGSYHVVSKYLLKYKEPPQCQKQTPTEK